MNDTDLAAIHAELSQIKLAMYVTGTLVLLAVVLGALRTYWVAKRGLRSELDNIFRTEAQGLLERNELEQLVATAPAMLRERPNDANAHWYLARAYYMQERWKTAQEEFEIVRKLQPDWNDGYVEPHLAEIRRRSHAAGEPV
jgi:cytochrome c-type biogenesis protein CcmH/NrfG